MKRLLDDGKYRSAGQIADAEGVSRSFVSRLLRLTLLAPDIVETILEGTQPKGVQLEDLTRAMSSGWEEQRRLFPTGLRPTNLGRTGPLIEAGHPISRAADADDEQRTPRSRPLLPTWARRRRSEVS